MRLRRASRTASHAHQACTGGWGAHGRRPGRGRAAAWAVPVRRLREFPPVMGLAFGSYGEASRPVHTLLAVLARAIAEREWRETGARTAAEARGVVMTQLRRRLSLATHAGHMRVLHALSLIHISEPTRPY